MKKITTMGNAIANLERALKDMREQFNNPQQLRHHFGLVQQAVTQLKALHDEPPVETDEQREQRMARTPPNNWNEQNPDEFADYYGMERAQLCLGKLPDDVLANAVFMYGDSRYHSPTPKDIIERGAITSGAYLTAAKERIRWLSRKVIRLEDLLRKKEPTPA